MKISLTLLQPWLDKMFEVIRKKILRLKRDTDIPINKNKYASKCIKTALKSLHDKFVVCTVDKASNNFAIICKKFFILALLEELGFDMKSFRSVHC